MKSRQIRITAATAIVSFVLGIAFASSWRKPDAGSVAGNRQTKPGDRSPSANLPDNAEEIPGRTRVGKREEKKKPSEPRISVPLSLVAKSLKGQHIDPNIMAPFNGIDKALPILGATEAQETEIKNSLRKAKDEILVAEKTQIKVIQADDTQIRLDNSAMKSLADSVTRRFQDDIRATLPSDTAELMISSIDWDRFYPTDEKSYPRLHIVRSTSGQMSGWVTIVDSSFGNPVHGFGDDGTPIPADQVFDDRWKPFLKGLTLLPQNEK